MSGPTLSAATDWAPTCSWLQLWYPPCRGAAATGVRLRWLGDTGCARTSLWRSVVGPGDGLGPLQLLQEQRVHSAAQGEGPCWQGAGWGAWACLLRAQAGVCARACKGQSCALPAPAEPAPTSLQLCGGRAAGRARPRWQRGRGAAHGAGRGLAAAQDLSWARGGRHPAGQVSGQCVGRQGVHEGSRVP